MLPFSVGTWMTMTFREASMTMTFRPALGPPAQRRLASAALPPVLGLRAHRLRCGACCVLVNRVAERACMLPAPLPSAARSRRWRISAWPAGRPPAQRLRLARYARTQHCSGLKRLDGQSARLRHVPLVRPRAFRRRGLLWRGACGSACCAPTVAATRRRGPAGMTRRRQTVAAARASPCAPCSSAWLRSVPLCKRRSQLVRVRGSETQVCFSITYSFGWDRR